MLQDNSAPYFNPRFGSSVLGATTAPQAQPASTLDIALNGAANTIEEAHNCLDLLEQHLCRVLQPTAPMPGENAKLTAAPAHSEAVERLQSQRMRLEYLVSRINDLRARAET